MEDLLTLREVATWLRVSWHTAYRLAPDLAATKVGHQLRVSRANVCAYIAKHTIPVRDNKRSQ